MELAAEVASVDAIRRALTSADFPAARATIADHRRRHAQGALRLEVDALAAELACRETPTTGSAVLDDFANRGLDLGLLARLQRVCHIASQKPDAAETPPV